MQVPLRKEFQDNVNNITILFNVSIKQEGRYKKGNNDRQNVTQDRM